MTDQERIAMLNYPIPNFMQQRYGIEMKKEGNGYVCCCPFDGHDDNTPSFKCSFVQKENCWLYNCFGREKCGGGNIFNLVMKKENVEFGEAVNIIASVTGLPNTSAKTYVNPKVEEYKNLMTAHADRYLKTLYTKEGVNGLKYLQRRGLTDETIKEFKLGYTPGNEMNYRKDVSYINNRISFPIYETINSQEPKVLGFCFRTLEDIYNYANWDGNRKYVVQNSTENELSNVWKKSLNLFNYHRALKYCRELGCVIVVEGYMDCISLWQSGIKNVVSTMGATIHDEQISLLSNMAKTVILYLDNDETGIKNTIPVIQKLYKNDFKVKVVISPDGKDGADLCLKHKFDYNKVVNLIYGNTVDATTFILDRATRDFTRTIDNARRMALEACLPFIEYLSDIEKTLFINKLYKILEMK